VRWPNSFSSAIRRRVIAVAATNSRLPRRASDASVEDKARIAQRLTMIGKNDPYLYWRYPPSVPTLTALPARPWRIAGTAATTATSCWRDSGVVNSRTIAKLTATSRSPSTSEMPITARRESRIVFP
jgi:hypothetical protein